MFNSFLKSKTDEWHFWCHIASLGHNEINYAHTHICRLWCLKQIYGTWISNYTHNFMWDVITYAWPISLLLAPHTILTHWGRVTYICISKLTIIGSDNGLAPTRRQAIIWTNVGILLIQNLRKNFHDILSKIDIFSFKKAHLKMSAKWQQFCLRLNALMVMIYVGWCNKVYEILPIIYY